MPMTRLRSPGALAVMEEARAFWTDRRRRRRWRLDIPGARRLSVRRALARLDRPDEVLADRIADAFTELRRTEYRLYPDAHATVDALRAAGVKLALVTNGAALTQRAKIERFELEPPLRPYPDRGRVRPGQARARGLPHALERLAVEAGDTWMVGDNYEWEVMAPQTPGHLRHLVRPLRAPVCPLHAEAKPARVIKRLGRAAGRAAGGLKVKAPLR